MRFAVFSLFALAASVSAAVVARDDATIEVEASLVVTVPTPEQALSCKCAADKLNGSGVHINQNAQWYQCAYPNGACMWAHAGPLMNTKQTNCQDFKPCTVDILQL